MSKKPERIHGLQDANLELGKPELTPALQEYVDRAPFNKWPNVVNMRRVVAKQLVEIKEVPPEAA